VRYGLSLQDWSHNSAVGVKVEGENIISEIAQLFSTRNDKIWKTEGGYGIYRTTKNKG